MACCGVPRHLPDGSPLRRDPRSLTRLAQHAVKDVYQFCSSYDRKKVGPYRRFIMDTRDKIAAQFREQHGCSVTVDGVERPNVSPYFIGVFDTVAALGHKFLGPALVAFVVLLLVVLQHFRDVFGQFYWLARLAGSAGVAVGLFAVLKNYLKMAPPLTGYSVFKRLATLHLTQPKHKFYDTALSPYVHYAKHAISIDENRADFARVSWSPSVEKMNRRDEHGNLYFEQIWFPGVHADIGGGYLENEARLSDVSLNWMVAAASIIPDGLKHDASVLRLSPDPVGPQHNEQAGGFLKLGVRQIPVDNATGVSRSPMHKSVYERFSGGRVLLYDRINDYRPDNMRVHVDFKHYSGQGCPGEPQCRSDNIELKWERAGYPGRL